MFLARASSIWKGIRLPLARVPGVPSLPKVLFFSSFSILTARVPLFVSLAVFIAMPPKEWKDLVGIRGPRTTKVEVFLYQSIDPKGAADSNKDRREQDVREMMVHSDTVYIFFLKIRKNT